MIFKSLTISIKPQEKSDYKILFSNSLEREWIEKLKKNKFSRYAIITDKNVYKYYKNILSMFENILEKVIIIDRPVGEEYKHIKYTQETYEELIHKKKLDRKSLIIALGGGVIGDYAGYIASTIFRGIPYVQIPTTLLAMVDSSVGGKVAVNLDIGKNMVGSFYQPIAVLCSLQFLQTLPEKEMICGLAEMLKHSLLDKNVYQKFHNTIKKNPNYKNWEPKIWYQLIYDSIKVKASVVSQDEKETGLRAILNLGHTVAHAIESISNYKKFSHGEAVSRGLVTSLLLSKKKYRLNQRYIEEVFESMRTLKLPMDTAGYSSEEIWSHMIYDKKNVFGSVKYIFLKDIGKPIYGKELDFKNFQEIWNEQKMIFG